MINSILAKAKDTINSISPLKPAKNHPSVPKVINVSHRYGVIFIHIPKNAGTSVAQALDLKESSHHTARQIKKICPEEFDRFFKFSFVRNPWDRFLSLYNYARLDESAYHSSIRPEKALYGKHRDYDLLRSASLQECALYLVEGKLQHDEGWNHWMPQAQWITNDDGKLIVDYVGRFESIEKDFEVVSKKVGLKRRIPIKNSSSKRKREEKSYREYFDAETQKIIHEYYKIDIELFGYDF